jgi:hypothetical protein
VRVGELPKLKNPRSLLQVPVALIPPFRLLEASVFLNVAPPASYHLAQSLLVEGEFGGEIAGQVILVQ